MYLLGFLVSSAMVFLVVVIFSSLVYAQSGLSTALQAERFGTEHGIAQSSVTSLAQDSRGFLWIATWGGLTRYDGYNFISFKHSDLDSTSLADNTLLSATYLSGDSLLLTLNGGGFSLFNTLRLKPIKSFGLPGSTDSLNGVSRFAVVSGKTLFLQSEEGIRKVDASGNYLLSGLPGGGKLYKENNSFFWVIGINSLFRVNIVTGTFSEHRFPPGVTNAVMSVNPVIIPLNDSLYLLATQQPSLLVFNLRSGKISSPEPSLGLSLPTGIRTITAMITDAENNIWIGSWEGIVLFKKEKNNYSTRVYKTMKDKSGSEKNAVVLSLLRDYSGIIWIGTTNGMYKYNPFHTLFTALVLPGKGAMPYAFIETQNGMLTGTNDGLVYTSSSGKMKVFTAQNSSLKQNFIHCFYRSKKGVLYIGSRVGLYSINHSLPEQGPTVIPLPGYEHIQPGILGITEDSRGILYLATVLGLLSYNPEKQSCALYVPPASLLGPNKRGLLSVFSKNDSLLYIGSQFAGMILFNTFTNRFIAGYKAGKSRGNLKNDKILNFIQDSRERIWGATLGGGLVKIVEESESLQFITYGLQEGLPDITLYGILEDSQGFLWISSNGGIIRFHPETSTSIHFTLDDGLPENEHNQNAFYRHSSGKMYFGTIAGAYAFYPEQITLNNFTPPVIITKLAVRNEDRSELLLNNSVRLKYTENFLSFEFAGLSYAAPSKNRYAYKLEGVDEDWVQSGSRRFANYTDLPPGEYMFRVKASNNTGLWNETGTALTITIVPPFWATWWFRLSAGIIVFSGIVLSISAATKRKYRKKIEALEKHNMILEERQKLRDKIARDLHDELASTVGGAGLFVESAKAQLKVNPEATEQYLNRTEALIREAEDAMSDIVWSVSPRYDTFPEVVIRIHRLAGELCAATGIIYSAQNITAPSFPADAETRRACYAIFKEALNNIIKHSEATEVCFAVTQNNSSVSLSLQDNGKGITNHSEVAGKGGNGLFNMKKRAEEISAVFEIQTDKHGTIITLNLNIPRLGY